MTHFAAEIIVSLLVAVLFVSCLFVLSVPVLAMFFLARKIKRLVAR